MERAIGNHLVYDKAKNGFQEILSCWYCKYKPNKKQHKIPHAIRKLGKIDNCFREKQLPAFNDIDQVLGGT